MDIPDRLRLPLDFDAGALRAEAEKFTQQTWISHYVAQNYDGDWSVIPLRAKAGATHPVMMIVSDPGCRDYEDTPFLAQCPALRAVLAAFQSPLEAVRLMRLGPASFIREHTDNDLRFEHGVARIHVPLVTSPDVIFWLNGSQIVLDAGTTWYLRLSDPHAVYNGGTQDRIHLVIDTRVDAWLEDLFTRALATKALSGDVDAG
jgi:hypothetical protein